MVSTKFASIIAVAAFLAGSFVASAELRAYAAAMITSADIVNETIQSIDIKDGEVKASDIATGAVGSNEISDGQVKSQDIGTDAVGSDELAVDAVGRAELQGVTNCYVPAYNFEIAAGATHSHDCSTEWSGGLEGSFLLATKNTNDDNCFVILAAQGIDDDVEVTFKNVCHSSQTFGGAQVSILLFR